MQKFKTNFIRTLMTRDISKMVILSGNEGMMIVNDELVAQEQPGDVRKEVLDMAVGHLYQYNKEWTVSLYVHHTGNDPVGFRNVVKHIKDIPLPEMHHHLSLIADEAAIAMGGQVTDIKYALWNGKQDTDRIHVDSIGLLMKHNVIKS